MVVSNEKGSTWVYIPDTKSVRVSSASLSLIPSCLPPQKIGDEDFFDMDSACMVAPPPSHGAGDGHPPTIIPAPPLPPEASGGRPPTAFPAQPPPPEAPTPVLGAPVSSNRTYSLWMWRPSRGARW